MSFSHWFIFLKGGILYCTEISQARAPAGGSSPCLRIQVLAILTEISVSVGFPLNFISVYFFRELVLYFESDEENLKKESILVWNLDSKGICLILCLKFYKYMFVNWKYYSFKRRLLFTNLNKRFALVTWEPERNIWKNLKEFAK